MRLIYILSYSRVNIISIFINTRCTMNTIHRYNIRYGRLTADDESVEKAAVAADIHNKIITFPEGYASP